MTEAEYELVREYAADTSNYFTARPQMEAIYLRDLAMNPRPLYMKFLSEVFSSSPDLVLRATYRKRVAEGAR